MKHAILATCGALTLAGTIAVSAQTPVRPPAPQPSPTTPSRTDDRSITVTGCLKTWDEKGGMVPTGGAAGTRYVLTNLEGDKAAAGMTSGPSTLLPQQYVLMPDSTVNLTPHVNHKVTLTGKTSTAMPEHAEPGMRPAEAGARPADPAQPGTPHAGMGAMDKAFATLSVSSLTMVAATCPAPTNQ